MRKSYVALLLLVGAAATLATSAFATDDLSSGDFNGKLMNAKIAKETSRVARLGTSAPGDTTWVGYNPSFASASNPWQIGVGANRPVATSNADRGYWDFETPINGDPMQGFWAVREIYTSTGGLTLPDDQRTWWAIDIGNQVNYKAPQGTKTTGVLGVWHSDPGGPGTPGLPGWTPLAGTRSAWCGLRAAGDVSEKDPITGNPYNSDALFHIQLNTVGNGTGTSKRFPGYAGQWDQMLYRDVTNPVGPGANVSITFQVRTRMSVSHGTTDGTRTGWFDKDPLAIVPGNYIRNAPASVVAPRDSFMVYVGNPVEPDGDPNNANDFVASDGLSYDVADAQRRWFSEVIRTEGGSLANTHYELYTVAGNNDSTVTVSIPRASVQAYGSKFRLVFRNKTNRGFDDENASTTGQYNSGRAGAVQIDGVTVDTGAGAVLIGAFENATDIDNSTGVTALSKWKSTGRPPKNFHHVRNISELIYQDLCGPPGGINRICNMFGNVVSMGDVDQSEAAGGLFGTSEQERNDGMMSPTINLRAPAVGTNNMGLDAGDVVVENDFMIFYEIYTGIFDFFTQGNGWQFIFQSYPATQADGVVTWGEYRLPGFLYFNPDKQCFQNFDLGYANGLIRTSNPGLQPDSLRIGLRKLQQCFRFGISGNCSPTLGAYWDNVSLGLVDGIGSAPISVDIWQLIQDTFPANEDSGLPGLAAFDTCGALIKSGLNVAQTTGNASRFDIPGDTTAIVVEGLNVRADMVFRISPGPGNYVTVGDRASGLRKRPDGAAIITGGDGSFWSEYIASNGAKGTPAGHPAGAHATRWSRLVWNSARMDTTDVLIFPTLARGIGLTAEAGGGFASMLHESDPKFNTLGLSHNMCFLNDTAGPVTTINCGSSFDPLPFPPAWVTTIPASRTGWNGSSTTKEGTKIIPDGLLTPGSHVQYFFRREDNVSLAVDLVPDTNTVNPQSGESSFDGHRWQQFSVLPDAWKKSQYGGLGQACMLYVDWNDRRGDERVWVSIADSIGATVATKYGAHNGWHAAGSASVNDAAGFVRNLNEQPGTTWDMYGVKAAESLNSGSGSLGARLAFRDEANPANKARGKVAKNAPTVAMLEAYYRILLILTGDLNSSIFGPFTDKSQDDQEIVTQYVLGATSTNKRGIFVQGHGFVESMEGDPWLNTFGVALRNRNYKEISGNIEICADLIPQAQITGNGDIYGVQTICTFTNDVLETTGPDAAASSLYQNVGSNGPYISGVFKDANAPNYWQTIVDGFDLFNLRSRFCENTNGRLAYMYNAFSNVFGTLCAVAGTPTVTLDTPNNDNGRSFVDFMRVGNNPLVKGSAVIAFGLPTSDRVSLKVFDVSGRLVRTLSDRQLYRAGEHQLLWDGVDNHGRQVSRGVYFANYTTERGVTKNSKITVVLK